MDKYKAEVYRYPPTLASRPRHPRAPILTREMGQQLARSDLMVHQVHVKSTN